MAILLFWQSVFYCIQVVSLLFSLLTNRVVVPSACGMLMNARLPGDFGFVWLQNLAWHCQLHSAWMRYLRAFNLFCWLDAIAWFNSASRCCLQSWSTLYFVCHNGFCACLQFLDWSVWVSDQECWVNPTCYFLDGTRNILFCWQGCKLMGSVPVM